MNGTQNQFSVTPPASANRPRASAQIATSFFLPISSTTLERFLRPEHGRRPLVDHGGIPKMVRPEDMLPQDIATQFP
jgi:hypothetical protein